MDNVWKNESPGGRSERLRIEMRLTQAEFGRLVNLTDQAVNSFEKEVNKLEIRAEYAETFARALGVSVDYLLNGESHAEKETREEAIRMIDEGLMTRTEAEEVMAMAAIRFRNKMKIPLNRMELLTLLMVVRG